MAQEHSNCTSAVDSSNEAAVYTEISNAITNSYPRSWHALPYAKVCSSSIKLEDIIDDSALKSRLQTEYWWTHNTSVSVSSDLNNCLKDAWLSNRPEKIECLRVELSEYQVIRECLWTLLGTHRGILFESYTDLNIIVKNICVPTYYACLKHLTYSALDSLLASVAEAASCHLQIRAFIDFILLSSSSPEIPTCFQGLVESCSNLISEFCEAISELETNVRMHRKRTLISLLNELVPWFQRLNFVANMLLQTSSAQLATLQHNLTAVLFINRLELLSQTYVHCTSDERIIRFIEQLYANSLMIYLEPFIKILCGRNFLTDLKSIPFLRLTYNSLNHPDFWNSGVTVCSEAVPNILRVMLPHIVRSLKSMLLLRFIASEFANSKLAEQLQQVPPLVVLPNCLSNPQINNSKTGKPVNEDKPTIDILYDDSDAEFCTLVSHLQLASPVESIHKLALYSSSSVPIITRNYEKRLEDSIKVHSKIVSLILVSYIREEGHFSLTSALTLLSNILLFRNGCQMHDFCTRLFHRQRRLKMIAEKDDLEINEMLQDSLQVHYSSQLAHLLHVSIGEQEVTSEGTAGFLKGLTVSFEAPWPLNILITPEVIKIYNGAFTFLLMIKRAKWALENQYFISLSKSNPNRHKLALLRSRLLFIVNGLHSFLIDHIEAAHIIFLDRAYFAASSLDDLLKCCKDFRDRINDICLLHPSSQILRRAIMGLLDLALRLETLWTSSIFSSSSFVEVEQLAGDFTAHTAFLLSMTTQAIITSRSTSLLSLQQVFATVAHFNGHSETRLH